LTTPEIIEKILKIVMEDRILKWSEIAKAIKIWKERVGNINIYTRSNKQKHSARWVVALANARAKVEAENRFK